MNDNEFLDLLGELSKASKECIKSQIASYEVGKRYAPLCIQVLLESRMIPKLINNKMEKRKSESGLDPVHPDFWNADMIIALAEHYQGVLERAIKEADGKTKCLVSSR